MNITDISKRIFEYFVLITGLFLIGRQMMGKNFGGESDESGNAVVIAGFTLVSAWLSWIVMPRYLSQNFNVPDVVQRDKIRPDYFRKNYKKEYYIH